jgi:hypothetical protein
VGAGDGPAAAAAAAIRALREVFESSSGPLRLAEPALLPAGGSPCRYHPNSGRTEFGPDLRGVYGALRRLGAAPGRLRFAELASLHGEVLRAHAASSSARASSNVLSFGLFCALMAAVAGKLNTSLPGLLALRKGGSSNGGGGGGRGGGGGGGGGGHAEESSFAGVGGDPAVDAESAAAGP